jgi:hypothetical protein
LMIDFGSEISVHYTPRPGVLQEEFQEAIVRNLGLKQPGAIAAAVRGEWFYTVDADKDVTGAFVAPLPCPWCSKPGTHPKCERYREAAKARAEAGYYYGTEAERESVMRWVDKCGS